MDSWAQEGVKNGRERVEADSASKTIIFSKRRLNEINVDENNADLRLTFLESNRTIRIKSLRDFIKLDFVTTVTGIYLKVSKQ